MTGRKESVFQMQRSQWTKIWSSEPPPIFCIFDPAQINTFQEAKIVKIDSFLARELPGHFRGPLEASLG